MTARLELEYRELVRVLSRSRRVRLRRVSEDRRIYEIGFELRTLVRGDAGAIEEQERNVGVVYELHREHPLRAPLVVARDPDLFNPNIYDPARGDPLPPVPLVCLGAWEPRMRLWQWVLATYDLLRWARVATQSPLDPVAADWRRSVDPRRFPIDARPFDSDEPEPRAGDAPQDAVGGELRLLGGWRSA